MHIRWSTAVPHLSACLQLCVGAPCAAQTVEIGEQRGYFFAYNTNWSFYHLNKYQLVLVGSKTKQLCVLDEVRPLLRADDLLWELLIWRYLFIIA